MNEVNTGSILIVEDDDQLRIALERILVKQGYDVMAVVTAEDALKVINKTSYDLVITDLKLPGIDGLELVRAVRRYKPETSIIMTTAYATVDSAVKAMKEGAEDYIAKPFNLDEIRMVVGKVFEKREMITRNLLLQNQLARKYAFENIIGHSERMVEVYKLITQVKDSKSTVLILGETGTGKDLVARAIHYNSLRSDRLYMPVNCGALQENLLASELFGYVKGAFTGALHDKRGLFEVAAGGTIFLDEIGDVSLGFQQTLLRALDSGEIQPVGAVKRTKVDVRIIAATNKDIEAMVATGDFREDLFYRLNVITIQVPPLRERKEDIALLAHHFLAKYSREADKDLREIDSEAMRLLEEYPWPGNVRELENTIERSVLLERDTRITPASLPAKLREKRPCNSGPLMPENDKSSLTLENLEKSHIISVLRQMGGNRAQAAKCLGINRSTLWRMMIKYNIEDANIHQLLS